MPKDNLGISGKGLIASLGIKAKERPKRYKNESYAIGNVSWKYLSKIIREFEKVIRGGGPNTITPTVTFN